MGWTYYWAPSTTKTADLVIKDLEGKTKTRQWEVIDHAMRGSVFYGLVKVTDLTDGTVSHYGAVWLTSRRNGEFGYKDMSEGAHPYYYDCPKRILDKLDKLAPNPGQSAREWRQRCRDKAAKGRGSKLVDGQVITFTSELNFRTFKESKFTVKKIGSKVRFVATNGTLCQITGWKNREFA